MQFHGISLQSLSTKIFIECLNCDIIYDMAKSHDEEYFVCCPICKTRITSTVQEPKHNIKYSGNKRCDICQDRKSLAHFTNRTTPDICNICIDLALNAYYEIKKKCENENREIDWSLVPSKNIYMKDWLKRYKEELEKIKD